VRAAYCSASIWKRREDLKAEEGGRESGGVMDRAGELLPFQRASWRQIGHQTVGDE